MLCLIIFKKLKIFFKKIVITIAILFLQFVKLQIKNSTNIIIALRENAKLYTILSIFWILIRNWNYIDIRIKSKSMKIKFQNAISKMHIRKKFSNYFRKYYAKNDSENSTTSQFILKNDEVIQSNNAMNINWFENNQQLLHENFYSYNHDKLIYRVTKMFIIYATKKFRITFQFNNNERIMRRFIQDLRKWRKIFFFAQYFQSKWNMFWIWHVEFVVEIVHKLHEK